MFRVYYLDTSFLLSINKIIKINKNVKSHKIKALFLQIKKN